MDSAKSVANFFIEKGDYSQLHIQKLVYFAYGWYMAATKGGRLFREPIEAWDYGPVIPDVYHCLKETGSSMITEPIEGVAPVTDADTIGLLDAVNERYGDVGAFDMVTLTHVGDTPWTRARQRGRGAKIRDSDIQEHFELLAADRAQ